jgi:hypothetical protein
MAPNDEISQLRAEVKRLRSDNEQLHHRLDDIAREFADIRRLLTPAHLSGLVAGHFQAHLHALPQANGAEIAGAVRDLVAQLSKPVHRDSEVKLPNGGTAHMRVTETR